MKKNANIENNVILHDDEFYYELLRKNLKMIRKSKGLTQQELADLTELTHGYVRDLECLTIDKTPTLETIAAVDILRRYVKGIKVRVVNVEKRR